MIDLDLKMVETKKLEKAIAKELIEEDDDRRFFAELDREGGPEADKLLQDSGQ